MISIDAVSQSVRASNAENGLVGIKLYDTGQRVISMYGSPLEIQPINFGGTAIGPGGGGGGAGGAGAGGTGAPSRAAGGAPAPTAPPNFIDGVPNGDWGVGNELLRQKAPGGDGDEGPRGGAGPGQRAGGGGGGNAAGAGGGGSDQSVAYTRWVYKRGMSKYGFVLDKFNRVVQIEAIGMQDGKVKTRKGVGFGSSFGTLIKKYGTPDGYEINGDTIVVRFLQRNKVAFRLNRLGKDKTHQVTGIVVAGGKA